MCGICGFTGYRQDQKTVIERMMKAIEHRGPDSEGSFCREKITLCFLFFTVNICISDEAFFYFHSCADKEIPSFHVWQLCSQFSDSASEHERNPGNFL